MSEPKNKLIKTSASHSLFDRVVAILEQARANVVRSVNSEMTIAYWLIGSEIIEEEQKGSRHAEYGKQIIEDLSEKLKRDYGRGFSTTNLRYFRTFYLTYKNRTPEIRHIESGELDKPEIRHMACGELPETAPFHPNLGWSHYRTLMRVENKQARAFYEIEASKNNWSLPQLEKQIHSFLFERLLKSRDKEGMLQLANEGQILRKPIDALA